MPSAVLEPSDFFFFHTIFLVSLFIDPVSLCYILFALKYALVFKKKLGLILEMSKTSYKISQHCGKILYGTSKFWQTPVKLCTEYLVVRFSSQRFDWWEALMCTNRYYAEQGYPVASHVLCRLPLLVTPLQRDWFISLRSTRCPDPLFLPYMWPLGSTRGIPYIGSHSVCVSRVHFMLPTF